MGEAYNGEEQHVMLLKGAIMLMIETYVDWRDI